VDKMVGITLVGFQPLGKDADGWKTEIPTKFEKQMARVGEIVVGNAQRMFKGSRTRAKFMIKGGKRVKRKGKGRAITSPPHQLGIFEGTYRKSISYEVKRYSDKVTTTVGPVGIKYARVHEFGIGPMPERPVLGPAVDKSIKKAERLLGISLEVVR